MSHRQVDDHELLHLNVDRCHVTPCVSYYIWTRAANNESSEVFDIIQPCRRVKFKGSKAVNSQ